MKKNLLLGGFLATAMALGAAYCIYNGIFWPNTPSLAQFPVRGIDVSHHQGSIDWKRIAQENIRFAFIKATEGENFTDPRFAANWENAMKTPLRVGAYHFFRAEKNGEVQARNFIAAVPRVANALPPVLDVECPVLPDAAERQKIRQQIAQCLVLLEAHYRVKPVIYTTSEAYEAYLQGDFGSYPLWIRSIVIRPRMQDGRSWTFWQ